MVRHGGTRMPMAEAADTTLTASAPEYPAFFIEGTSRELIAETSAAVEPEMPGEEDLGHHDHHGQAAAHLADDRHGQVHDPLRDRARFHERAGQDEEGDGQEHERVDAAQELDGQDGEADPSDPDQIGGRGEGQGEGERQTEGRR